ncbi:MAG TPA: hydantoinase/oxoprolinase family protein, partial [Ktedonobacteraceae bacterium]|nr:hydantoinase/oxoprolinase family protein [Ktedonobacteraceae bacterium]
LANPPQLERRESKQATTPTPTATRDVVFTDSNRSAISSTYRTYQVPVYERGVLEPGNKLTGPAIITQYDTTTILPPGWRSQVDAVSNLIIVQIGEEREYE